jgi:hypothetical protein
VPLIALIMIGSAQGWDFEQSPRCEMHTTFSAFFPRCNDRDAVALRATVPLEINYLS